MHNGDVLETLPRKTPLVAALHESHLYFYKTASTRKKLLAWKTPAARGSKLRREHAASATTPPAHEWEPFAFQLIPGHYYCSDEDMPQIRGWFLAQGRCPRVVMKDPASIRTLIYQCTKIDQHKGAVVIHNAPVEFDDIKRWLKKLPIALKYTGQGLPAIASQVLLQLVKHGKTREYLTGEQKAELLEQHGWACSHCGGKSPDLEWDHTEALRQLVPGMPQRFAPLCSACHQVKTANEPRSLSFDFLASHFEKSVYDSYVLSPRPPPMVYRLKGCDDVAGCQIADIIRCRKRALEFNVHDIPIFCPLDSVEEVEGYCLGDVNFVVKPPRKSSATLEMCYTQGWQHRCLTEFLLHYGVISWEHVTHRITATGRYPASTFAKPLRQMENAWREIGTPELAKRAVNSLIGLWAIDESFDYKCYSSRHEQDCPPEALKSTFHYEGGQIMDFPCQGATAFRWN